MQRRFPLGGAIGLGAALMASTATAQDAEGGLRLVFGIEERLEYGRNLALAVPAEGSTASAATTLSFGLYSSTPLDRLEFTASAALLVENAPDTDGTVTEFARPRLGFSYTREVPNAVFGIDLSYIRDDVDSLAEDLEDADATGTETDYGVALRFETGRTTPASFFVTAAHEVTEYEDTTDPDLIDTTTTSLEAGTRLRFSEVLTGTVSLEFSREDEDGAPDTTDTLTAAFGLEHALANGSASLDLTHSTEDGGEDRTTITLGRTLELPAGTLAARLGLSRSDLGGTDLVGGLDWSQRLPDGGVTVSLERSTSYDSDDGETTVDTALSVEWTHEINALSSLAADASWALSDAASERIEETGLGVTYRTALTRDWELASGLRYIWRDDADGHAESPMVFVSLGRSFTLRP